MKNEEIIHCKDCKHWHTFPTVCPMCYEVDYDDDGWAEYYTVDNTKKDGSGFCNFGEEFDENGEYYV